MANEISILQEMVLCFAERSNREGEYAFKVARYRQLIKMYFRLYPRVTNGIGRRGLKHHYCSFHRTGDDDQHSIVTSNFCLVEW